MTLVLIKSFVIQTEEEHQKAKYNNMCNSTQYVLARRESHLPFEDSLGISHRM